MAEKVMVPVPDPLGLLEDLTRDADITFYDPVFSRKASKSKPASTGDVSKYVFYLEKAIKYAPCPSCKQIVISALTAAEIYKKLEREGKSREDISKHEIEEIRRKIEEKYS